MPALKLRRIANSLAARMLALVLAVLIFGAALSYVLFTRFLTRDMIEVAQQRQSALADYVAGNVEHSLQDRLRTLQRLAADLPRSTLAQPAQACAWLAERYGLNPDFPLGFALFDVQGQPLVACAMPGGHEPRPAAADIERALAGQAVIGRAFRDPRSSQPALPFAVPLRDATDGIAGVLSGTAAVAAEGFLDLQSQGRIGRAGGLLLVSPPDKLFIGATEPAMFFKPTPAPGVNLLHDRAMAGYRGSGVTVNAFGVEEISAIASVPSTGWFVVARSPTADALATVKRGQRMILWQRIPAMLLVAAMVAGFMIWWLRPLFQAARQAEHMTLGEIPLAPLPVVREDEIGHLTRSFNHLLAKMEQQQAELVRLAHHDGLTGLPNRRLFADRVQQASARAQRQGTRLAVLFLDLDGFKQVNDGLGHEAGDEVLRHVAARLVGVVRASDTVARLGGDEFVVLAPDLGDNAEAAARVLVDKCVDAVSRPLSLLSMSEGHTCRLGVSVGAAFSDGSSSLDTLLSLADRAMYSVKAGRSLAA